MRIRTLIQAGCLLLLAALFAFAWLIQWVGSTYGWLYAPLPLVALLVLVYLGRGLAVYLFMIPFLLKSSALRGAKAVVSSCARTGGVDEEKRALYRLEVEIIPRGQSMWDPGELMIVGPEDRISLREDPTGGDVPTIMESEAFIDGAWTKDFDKLTGPLKLRLTVAATVTGEVVWRYYFNHLGRFTLPSA